MKYFPIFLLFINVFYSCKTKTDAVTTSPTSLETSVDSLVNSYIDSTKAAGAAVAVFKKNEKVLLKSYGFADLEFKTKLPKDASFEIGSVSKQFTTAAVLQLADSGKINLDEDFTKYVKFNTQGRKISVRRLMDHTSGIRGYTEMPAFGSLAPFKYPRDTLLRIVEKEKFDFEPGEALIYNNTAFFILGLILEKVTGSSYENYVQKNLFDKAGMKNSYYCSESKVILNRAHGYDMGEHGLQRAGYLDHTWPYSAGSLCSTAEDLVKWNEALHHGKILSEKMYGEFLTTAVFNNGDKGKYAKGITVTEDHGKKMLEHGGGIFGFLSENRFYPNEDISIIVLINSTGPMDPGKVANHIADILFGKPKEISNFYAGDLTPFTGTYSGRGRGEDIKISITKKDSTLIAKRDDKETKLNYLQGNTWINDHVEYTFKGNELFLDQVYGYLVLKK